MGFLSPVSGAFACTAPTEHPYDPTQFPSDVVLEGIATSRGQCAGDPCADVKVTNVYLGSFAASAYRLKWWDGAGGMCDPPGPDLKLGQQVRIYLTKEPDGFRPQGWVLANDIPKPKSQIQKDQVIAQARAARQAKYFKAGGALSYNDPKDWLKIEDIPELRGSSGMVFVSFSVSPTGTMENCTPGHVAKYDALDQKACKTITKRARLVPPRFPEEARGSILMYPPEPEEASTAQTEHFANTEQYYGVILAFALAFVAVGGGLLIWWIKRGKSHA